MAKKEKDQKPEPVIVPGPYRVADAQAAIEIGGQHFALACDDETRERDRTRVAKAWEEIPKAISIVESRLATFVLCDGFYKPDSAGKSWAAGAFWDELRRALKHFLKTVKLHGSIGERERMAFGMESVKSSASARELFDTVAEMLECGTDGIPVELVVRFSRHARAIKEAAALRTPGSPAPPPSPRLRVDVAGWRVWIGDDSYEVSANAAPILAALVEAAGQWISVSAAGGRTRDLESLPPPVADLIETERAKGTRIKPEWF